MNTAQARARVLPVASLTIIVACTHAASGAAACVASLISVEEAKQLLQHTPDLLSVRRAGGKPVAERNADRDAMFFHFSVYDTGPAGHASADGGLVGHYAVSRKTAQVFDDVLFQEIQSVQLQSAQNRLRGKHCVTTEVLRGASHEVP